MPEFNLKGLWKDEDIFLTAHIEQAGFIVFDNGGITKGFRLFEGKSGKLISLIAVPQEANQLL